MSPAVCAVPVPWHCDPRPMAVLDNVTTGDFVVLLLAVLAIIALLSLIIRGRP